MADSRSLSISPQYIGPPDLGNGGYVVGLLAEALVGGDPVGRGAFEVTLRGPLPISKPLSLLAGDNDQIELADGDTLLATARKNELDLIVPEPGAVEDVIRGQAGSLSLKVGDHPTLGERLGVHPICFCCGAEREEGDGLRVFPVAVGEGGAVTAVWTPHAAFAREDGTVGAEVIAAAIDCPGAFAFLEEGKRAGLLGRMTVEFLKPLQAGQRTRIVGWQIGEDGRKMIAGTALFDGEGDVVAKSLQVWFGYPG